MGKNVALARSMGLLRIPDDSLVDIEKIGDLDPRRVCVISTGSQGEPMSALALMAAGDNKWITVGDGRPGHPLLARHPRQRDQRRQGHRRPVPPRRRGGPLGAGRGPRERPRQAGGAEDPAVDRPAGLLHPGARRVPPPDPPRPAGRGDGGAQARVLLAEDGDVVELTERGIDFVGEVPAGYLYVDGIVGDVGRGVLRDRRVLAEEGVVDRGRHRRRQVGRGARRPRDHHPGLGVRPRSRGAAGGGPRRRCWPRWRTAADRGRPTSRRCAGGPARRWDASCTSAPGAGR